MGVLVLQRLTLGHVMNNSLVLSSPFCKRESSSSRLVCAELRHVTTVLRKCSVGVGGASCCVAPNHAGHCLGVAPPGSLSFSLSTLACVVRGLGAVYAVPVHSIVYYVPSSGCLLHLAVACRAVLCCVVLCRGWSKMATPSTSFRITQVSPPRVGEKHPASVQAEVVIDTRSMRGDVASGWDELKQHDVLFLLGGEAAAADTNFKQLPSDGSAEQGLVVLMTA